MAYATDSGAAGTRHAALQQRMSRPRIADFERPPVVEVVLSVQFEELAGFGTPQVGLLWQRYREQFPVTEQHPPLSTTLEVFGVKGVPEVALSVELVPTAPPRCWFLNDTRTELIQVQANRFIHNWRKVGTEDQYPRFEHVRACFQRELGEFQAFVQDEQLGHWTPNQCEVTYVNQIVAGEGWTEHGEIGNVLTVFQAKYSDTFLGLPENAKLDLRFILKGEGGEPIGRLHISAVPGYRRSDSAPVIRLTLTARGRPSGDGVEGVLEFLNKGRETIVESFASITTPEMHRIWGRKP